MTEDQATRYIQSGGTHCPHCGGVDLDGKGVSIDAGTATQEVMCTDCGRGWTDVYTLSHVESN